MLFDLRDQAFKNFLLLNTCLIYVLNAFGDLVRDFVSSFIITNCYFGIGKILGIFFPVKSF